MATSIRWRNDGDRYGVISIVLHWAAALTVLAMLVSAALIWAAPDHAAGVPLLHVHGSIGTISLPLIALRIIWHFVEPRPAKLDPGKLGGVARAVHVVMLVLIAAQLVTGPVDVWSGGWPIGVFDWFALPSPLGSGPPKPWHDSIGTVHRYTGYVIATLIALHIAAALKHLLIDRDGTVQRMLGIDGAAQQAMPPVATTGEP